MQWCGEEGMKTVSPSDFGGGHVGSEIIHKKIKTEIKIEVIEIKY